MNNSTENKSIYGEPYNSTDIVCWIKNNLSTSKKFINANYTKNSFALLKTKYPEIWEQIKGKTIEYCNADGKKRKISFLDKCYSPLSYNGVVVSTSSIWKNTNMQILVNNTNSKSTLKDIIQVCIANNLSGIQIFKIAEKAFPKEYNILRKIRIECISDREAVYCYFYEKPPLKCNGKQLHFRTLSTGYSYEALAEYANLNYKQSEHSLVVNLSLMDPFSVIHFVKTYFPTIHNNIVSSCPANSESESYHLFINEKDKPDSCLFCHKKCRFKNLNFGYYSLCSKECASAYNGINNRKYRDPAKWSQYKKLVEYYTNISYKKFISIINPANYKRGIKDYHVDHIIPKVYGFEHNLDPKRISHFKNLQMLTSKENNKKHAKVVEISYVDVLAKLTDSDLEYLNCHDSDTI
jgi:hypothetical protein